LHRLNWVPHDIIMTWLHIIWYRDLCNHRDRIWWFGIAFHITWYYYCISVATISKFWHSIWYCNLSMHLYILLYYVTCYMGSYGILYDVIMACHWSLFLVNGASCSNAFIYNLYNIILHNPWSYYCMPLVIICWYFVASDVALQFQQSLWYCIVIYFITFWEDYNIVYDIIAISLLIIYCDILQCRMVLL